MHRLLVENILSGTGEFELSGEALRHLRVLRPEEGELFELFDGKGSAVRCRWHAAKSAFESAPGEYSHERERRTQKRSDMTLFACITKGSRWDWTIEKATELGVGRIVPVVSQRTIVRIPKQERATKRERWLRVANDAARQSSALWLPEIVEAVDFDEALELARETKTFAGALVDPEPEPLLCAIEREIARDAHARLSIFTGPEGDFTPDEMSALLAFATPASFGPLVLRAETAAIYGLTVLAAALEAAQAKKRDL